MIEVRFHGRGGQGAVIASNILAEAAFKEGKNVQSFPHFGVERRGAPVAAFTRIDSGNIRIRNKIYKPDHVVVLDPTLMESVDVTGGLKEGGFLLINTHKSPNTFSLGGNFKVATIDASRIAMELGLGSKFAPIVNTAIIGALSEFSKIVGLESVLYAIGMRVPLKLDENKDAARVAYREVRVG